MKIPHDEILKLIMTAHTYIYCLFDKRLLNKNMVKLTSPNIKITKILILRLINPIKLKI